MNTYNEKESGNTSDPEEVKDHDQMNSNIFYLINSQIHIGDNHDGNSFTDHLKSLIIQLIMKEPKILLIIIIIVVIIIKIMN